MWYEGSLLRWEDPSEDLINFYKENEHKSLDLTTIDNDTVWQEGQEELDYILDNTQLPWIPVPVNVPWKDIYEEAHQLLHTACYTAHRPNSSGWLSLAIHGMSSVHTNCPEDYGLPDSAEKDLSDWTDIAKFCPRTVEWMKDEIAYDQFTRVRFMAVLPGGWLAPHTDRSRIAGVGATNIAINNPDGCAMVMRDFGVFPFEPGTAFKINTGYEHAVWNRSDEPRIHMIFDGDQSDRFKERVREGYGKLLGKI